jgi:anti-sigma B factor antagonist
MHALVVSTTRRNGLVVVTARGELDIVGKPLLCRCVADALQAQSDGLLVIDLAQVSFMDAQGLSALVVSRRYAHALNRALVLARVPAAVRWLLGITGLDNSFVMVALPQAIGSTPEAHVPAAGDEVIVQ